MNYSVPINQKIPFSELKNHLFSLPEYPDKIPYLTSYYKENWGFCISHNQLINLHDDEYEVVIDSTLENGSLTCAEFLIPGESEDEVLFSCYTCHPSMCNDNLSGVVLFTFLAKYLKQIKLKYSYRFLFVPETIGVITWLSQNESNVKKIRRLGADETVISGFAGSTADAFALFERLEGKLDQYKNQLKRACVELAKDWRTDRYLRRLEAMMIVADKDISLLLSGTGDVIESDDGILAIGSGGPYANSAAKALIKNTEMNAEEIAIESLNIAADICIYTNHNIISEKIEL